MIELFKKKPPIYKYFITVEQFEAANDWWQKHIKKYHKGKKFNGYYHFDISPTILDDMYYCVCDTCEENYFHQKLNKEKPNFDLDMKAWNKASFILN